MHQPVRLARSSFLGSGGSEGRPWPSWAGAQEPGGKYLKRWRLRPAGRAANRNLRQMFHEFADLAQMLQELNPSSATGTPSVTLPACFADAQKACPEPLPVEASFSSTRVKSHRDGVHGPRVRFPPTHGVRENDTIWRFSSGITVCLCTRIVRFEKSSPCPAEERQPD